MAFRIGSLSQVMHITSDLAGANRFYGDVLGGDCYYSGHNPFEKRDASIFAIGDLTVEPMSPSDEPGALDLPVGKFLSRFGSRLHSVSINASGIDDLAEHLAEHGIRVFGPGGRPPLPLGDAPPHVIFGHPRDSYFLIEYVDFGGAFMKDSPRLAADWDPSRWVDHPIGLIGPSHLTVLVDDVDAATAFFDKVYDARPIDSGGEARNCRTARVMLGTETVIEFAQPFVADSRAGQAIEASGGGLHAVTLSVDDLAASIDYLAEMGVGTIERTDDEVLINPDDAAGAVIYLTERPPPTIGV